jgi:hypothetical protein
MGVASFAGVAPAAYCRFDIDDTKRHETVMKPNCRAAYNSGLPGDFLPAIS